MTKTSENQSFYLKGYVTSYRCFDCVGEYGKESKLLRPWDENVNVIS